MRGGRIVQAADPQTLYRDPVDAEVARLRRRGGAAGRAADGGRAETSLGRLADPRRRIAASGTGRRVMLRPEQILCRELGARRRPGPPGRVLSTAFYGHDATARIALDGPERREIVARAAGHLLPAVGQRVAIAVEGTAVAYPAESGDEPPEGRGGLTRILLPPVPPLAALK